MRERALVHTNTSREKSTAEVGEQPQTGQGNNLNSGKKFGDVVKMVIPCHCDETVIHRATNLIVLLR